METSSRIESYAQDESDCGTKKRKVVEEISAAYTLNEPKIASHEDPRSGEDTVLTDSHGCVAEHEIEPTFVMFEHFFGTGVIVHHSESMGLVAVNKNTVAISASDIMLFFADFPMEIPAEVVFLPPVHSYALIAYDPSALYAGASLVRSAQLFSESALRHAESVYLVGLSRNLQVTSRKSIVTNPCGSLNISSADSPRYRATNMKVIELDTGIFSFLTLPDDLILEVAKRAGWITSQTGIFCADRNLSGLKPFSSTPINI